MTHSMNCGYYDSEQGCTCCLNERIALQTEQTMHMAWRKRAEEAESQLAASQAECERLRRENLELSGVCPDCKKSLYWCECTKHGREPKP